MRTSGNFGDAIARWMSGLFGQDLRVRSSKAEHRPFKPGDAAPNAAGPTNFLARVKRFDGAQWKAVLLRDPCVYCGAEPKGLDHIQPKSRGGRDNWTNRAPSCRGCDQAKNSTPLLFYLVARQACEEEIRVRWRRKHYVNPNIAAQALRNMVRSRTRQFVGKLFAG